jgi:hypothetical protein
MLSQGDSWDAASFLMSFVGSWSAIRTPICAPSRFTVLGNSRTCAGPFSPPGLAYRIRFNASFVIFERNRQRAIRRALRVVAGHNPDDIAAFPRLIKIAIFISYIRRRTEHTLAAKQGI